MTLLLDCIMELGELMLTSGAEVHRVEDSLKRIFAAYGTTRTDVFIITSSMVVTIHTSDGQILTQTRRITETASDFERLHRLNALSREICANPCTAEEFRRRLDAVSAKTESPLWLEFICYAVIACVFTLFFGGGIAEAVMGCVTGALVRLVLLCSDRMIGNMIFGKFLASMLSTGAAFLSLTLSFIPTADHVIIGTIMTLIPGIGLTNALKDLLVGDSIAGLLRTIEACITALAIAAGYFSIAFLTGGSFV